MLAQTTMNAAGPQSLLTNLEAFLIALTAFLTVALPAAAKLAHSLGLTKAEGKIERLEGTVDALAHGLKKAEPNGGPGTDATIAHAEANGVEHPDLPKPAEKA